MNVSENMSVFHLCIYDKASDMEIQNDDALSLQLNWPWYLLGSKRSEIQANRSEKQILLKNQIRPENTQTHAHTQPIFVEWILRGRNP